MESNPQAIPDAPLTSVASITDFLDWFSLGNPVLMYHKLGPRPTGTQMKGLYVSERLFKRQLEQLNRYRFETPKYDTVIDQNEKRPRIFLSFDDGFESVLYHGITPLQDHGLRAIQFLVADKLGKTNDWETETGETEERLMDASQVRDWLAAGNEIGSHTLTHPRLTQLSEDQAREEISASRKKLEDLFGIPIKHFCYPFGDHDQQTIDLVQEAGYETGSTTIPGLNLASTNPFAIRRIMARHGTRKFRDIKQRWLLRIRRWWS